MSGSFYEHILLNIRDRQEFYQSKVLTGNLTHEEYKSMTGKIFGLIESEEAVKNAYKAMYEYRVGE